MTNRGYSSMLCKRLLYVSVLTLVFEGLFRKILPSFLGTALFFLKDILCLVATYVVLNTHSSKLFRPMLSLWSKIFLALLPLVLYTSLLSPALGIFGAKQYLLYIVISLMVPLAFPKEDVESLKRFLFLIVILITPTTSVAMLQNALPASHWLNLGVDGQSLAGFSAGGKLRVSSTFSFTGQYSFFLNMASVVLAASYFIQPKYKFKKAKLYISLIYSISALMLIIGNFITGGRTAVLGSGVCLFLGFALTGNRYPAWLVTRGVMVVFSAIFALSVLRVVKPEYFEAYEIRSKGSSEQSHSDEVEGRLLSNISGWTWWFSKRDFSAKVVGEGLGVMTNGSDKISAYAAQVRGNGFWTESDLATTMWEGGYFLAVVWYGIRLYVIFFCFQLCSLIQVKKHASAAYFLLGFVIVNSLLGTLSIQPPLAIWFWMCVGMIIAIQKSDSYIYQKITVGKKSSEIEVTVS